MKHTLKLSYILTWLGLLSIMIFMGSVNAAMKIWWQDIDTSDVEWHISRLHSLYVWQWAVFAWLVTKDRALHITNWLVVWNGTVNSEMGTIAWGNDNKISDGNHAWIAGWQGNQIISWQGDINKGDNSVIGWWNNNTIQWNNSVIVGGNENAILPSTQSVSRNWEGSVILWWNQNEASNGWIVFWWSKNRARWANNLVMWQNAKGWDGSFIWNDGSKEAEADSFSAYIWAENWILIGTYDPKPGVNLVVNGAMKIWWDTSESAVAWEIRVVEGCFYAYDWEYRHIINQSDSSECDALPISNTCAFGNVELQAWDEAQAYSARTSSDCSLILAQVVCTPEWKLVNKYDSSDETHKYAYCYTFTSN